MTRQADVRLDLDSAIHDVVSMGAPARNPDETQHWYDGLFFDLFVAPNQDPIFAAIRAAIPPGSRILDVGCGTGRLVFQLADHGYQVRGIDPSTRNIRRALTLHARRGNRSSIAFEATSLEAHLERSKSTYDVGVISYVLHEMDEPARVPLLRLLSGAARTLILADYRVPRRRGLMDAATEVVEFAAGRAHYRGFRSFVQSGGLPHLIAAAGLVNLGERPCTSPYAQVLVASAATAGRES